MATDVSLVSAPTCPVINTAAVQQYPFDIYVGTSTGFLKGCKLDKLKSYNINSVNVSQAKQLEITCMNWWNNNESFLLTARRDGCVFSYEPRSGKTFKVPIAVPDGSPSICSIRSDEKFTVTAFSNGIVKCNTFDLQSEDFLATAEESANDLEINAGTNLSCMDYGSSNLIATGGKENPLKIWDMSASKQPIFTAKNVKNDWLNLHVPIWVTHALFLPENNKVVTSTGYSQIRLYDPLTPQRRPVIEILLDDKNKKYPITALAARPHSDLQFVVGSTVGTLALADLRQKSIVKKYKGSTGGGIVDLKFHPTYPIFASCGMDSYLHCFDVNTSKKTHSMYLQSALNCLLFSTQLSLTDNNDALHKKSVRHEQEAEACIDSNIDDIDDVWKDMEVIQTKKRKSKSVSSERNQKKRKEKV